MKLRYLILASLASFVLAILSANAKQFPVFDGQTYNGLYYPRIDIIEWGEPFHLEFHMYSKDKPIDLAAVVGETNGHTVVWLNYDLKFRGEHVCRHAPAPPQFQKGQKIYAYRDSSSSEYDNIYLTSEPMKTSKTLVAFDLPPYYICPNDETASNNPDGPLPPGVSAPTPVRAEAVPAGGGNASSNDKRTPASVGAANEGGLMPESTKSQGKGVNVDYDNTAMPFSF